MNSIQSHRGPDSEGYFYDKKPNIFWDDKISNHWLKEVECSLNIVMIKKLY